MATVGNFSGVLELNRPKGGSPVSVAGLVSWFTWCARRVPLPTSLRFESHTAQWLAPACCCWPWCRRAAYLTRLGSMQKRILVAVNWALTLVFGRDLSRCVPEVLGCCQHAHRRGGAQASADARLHGAGGDAAALPAQAAGLRLAAVQDRWRRTGAFSSGSVRWLEARPLPLSRSLVRLAMQQSVQAPLLLWSDRRLRGAQRLSRSGWAARCRKGGVGCRAAARQWKRSALKCVHACRLEPGHTFGRHILRSELAQGLAAHTHTHTLNPHRSSPRCRSQGAAVPASTSPRSWPFDRGLRRQNGPLQLCGGAQRAAGGLPRGR